MDELQGNWEVVSVERDGRRADDAVGIRVTFDAGKMVTTARSRTGVACYRLDPSKQPRAVDFVYAPPREGWRPLVLPAIYRLEDERLIVCVPLLKVVWSVSGHADIVAAQRPGEFTTSPGSLRRLIVYKRESP